MAKAIIPRCFARGQRQHVFTRSDNTQTVDLGGSDQDGTIVLRSIMHCIFQKLAQCAPLSSYKENTQRIWSVTLLAPDA